MKKSRWATLILEIYHYECMFVHYALLNHSSDRHETFGSYEISPRKVLVIVVIAFDCRTPSPTGTLRLNGSIIKLLYLFNHQLSNKHKPN